MVGNHFAEGQQLQEDFHAAGESGSALFEHLKKNYPGGIYHAVYESGFSGYSSCYELRDLGVDCIITHAADVPTSQKERLSKTDAVDSAKLARSLSNGELKAVYASA